MKTAILVTITAMALVGISCQTSNKSNKNNMTVGPEPGFTQIFDGKTFDGWECDTSFWSISNGVVKGLETSQHQLKQNSFLIYARSQPADFELKADYRISEGGNSGIQYRSEKVAGIPYALKGYQADIDGANKYTGQNYEERGRGFLAMRGQVASLPIDGKPIITGSVGNSDSLKALIKKNDWNEIHLVVKGFTMKHYINGVLMSEAIDNDTVNRKSSGIIGFQLHVAPAMTIEFRNIRLKQ
ncbi:MAG TPA: DUF1080 domain-containing protein [Chitinophagaceae bacterium]|nr:DUF1080 domain-containing protein [Chitinophagaceae bacterium]